ncbi:hypothetical protein IFM89_020249 [Coptis chinensis]|uniref:Uncharacterized protein n=1 Tax=Coptis chinensis TaxID=261450 RepID=A0A835HNI0_9MAGN|nr:hypothetical protein IFM89_020249 [Coptis chinensis]
MYKNFKKNFGAELWENLIWGAAKAYKQQELIKILGVINKTDSKALDWYCSPYFSVEAFKATYANYLYPLDNIEDWPEIVDKTILKQHLNNNHLNNNHQSNMLHLMEEANKRGRKRKSAPLQQEQQVEHEAPQVAEGGVRAKSTKPRGGRAPAAEVEPEAAATPEGRVRARSTRPRGGRVPAA